MLKAAIPKLEPLPERLNGLVNYKPVELNSVFKSSRLLIFYSCS